MTHKWVEALGMVLVEALACGVPVITYRRGGPSEMVVDGETGWLVEPDALDEFIAAMNYGSRIFCPTDQVNKILIEHRTYFHFWLFRIDEITLSC